MSAPLSFQTLSSQTPSSSSESTDEDSTSESCIFIAINPLMWIRLSDLHEFVKPNDIRALRLMDRAARSVMDEYEDVVLAFGESDEYR